MVSLIKVTLLAEHDHDTLVSPKKNPRLSEIYVRPAVCCLKQSLNYSGSLKPEFVENFIVEYNVCIYIYLCVYIRLYMPVFTMHLY